MREKELENVQGKLKIHTVTIGRSSTDVETIGNIGQVAVSLAIYVAWDRDNKRYTIINKVR